MNRATFMAILLAAATCPSLGLVLGCRSASSVSLAPKALTDAEMAAVAAAPLGSIKNPVRCDGVQGERCYIVQLRCPSGDRPRVEGRFSIIERSPYGTILDEYILRCPDWAEPRSIFLDMYHSGVLEGRPAHGFAIATTE